jgi:hypothetical protein
MNREQLIELAKNCGYWSGQTIEMNDIGLEQFAKLVAQEEREWCAYLCSATAPGRDAEAIEEAIRARGSK